MELNREGVLDVTDLSGNPFRRILCFGQTAADVPEEQEPRRCRRLNSEFD